MGRTPGRRTGWVVMPHDVNEWTDTLKLAEHLKINKYEATGIIHQLWSWFDKHTADGIAPPLLHEALKKALGGEVTMIALSATEWIDTSDGGVVLVNYERDLSKEARNRKLSADRMFYMRERARAAGVPRTDRRRKPKPKIDKEKVPPPKRMDAMSQAIADALGIEPTTTEHRRTIGAVRAFVASNRNITPEEIHKRVAAMRARQWSRPIVAADVKTLWDACKEEESQP